MIEITILVIGGSGFIGGKVVEALAKQGMDTLSYDILHSYSLSEKTKWIQADILELQSIERLFYEFDLDAIVHLVGLPSIGYCEKNPHFSFQLNTLSVQNTLEAMRKTDVKKIIFASSASVYGYSSKVPVKETDPTNPNTVYGFHKLIAEEAIRAYYNSYGLDYVILRLFNIYGGDPNMGKDVISIFIRRALKGEPILVKGSEKFRDFLHVNDCAAAFAKALKTDVSGMTINLGTGKTTTLRELAEITKGCFANVDVRYEKADDDGTGLLANIELAQNTLGFSVMNPKDRIREFISSNLHE